MGKDVENPSNSPHVNTGNCAPENSREGNRCFTSKTFKLRLGLTAVVGVVALGAILGLNGSTNDKVAIRTVNREARSIIPFMKSPPSSSFKDTLQTRPTVPSGVPLMPSGLVKPKVPVSPSESPRDSPQSRPTVPSDVPLMPSGLIKPKVPVSPSESPKDLTEQPRPPTLPSDVPLMPSGLVKSTVPASPSENPRVSPRSSWYEMFPSRSLQSNQN